MSQPKKRSGGQPGHEVSEETRKKIRQSVLRRYENPEYRDKVTEANLQKARRGEDAPNWKQDADLTYGSLHGRVATYHGTPALCEHCGLGDPSRTYNWAHVHQAPWTSDREHWIRLCVSCHRKYDLPADFGLKMSRALRGRKLSDAHRAAVSEGLKRAYREGRRG